MQKIFFTVAIALTALIVNGQTAEEAAKQLDKRKLKEAKEIIDKLTTDPNGKDAYAWLVKAQVYNAIASDDAMKLTVPDAYEQAFEAYKKAYDANSNLNQIKLDFYQTAYRAYDGVAGKASLAFQNSNYPLAFDTYKKLLGYGTYLNAKGLANNGFPAKFDTAVIFYMGYIAMKLDKEDDAVIYFSKLANAKIGKETDYIIPYQYLAYTYKEKKDADNFKKYVNLGKQLYPNSPYFVSLTIDWDRDNIEAWPKNHTKVDWVNDNNFYPELFQSYEELIPMQPDSIKNHLIYANDMFEYIFVKNQDKKLDSIPDHAALVSKIDQNLQVTLKSGYDSLNALLLLTGLYYNQGYDLSTEVDKIKTSTKPDDVKKRKDLRTKAAVLYDKSIPYSLQAVSILERKGIANMKTSEKQTIKNLYGWLGDMYRLKSDKAKEDGDAVNSKALLAKADEFDKKWEAVSLK
jgi:tetratricopeptide (TPR) repeat protein